MPCYHPIPASQDSAGARVVLYPPGHVGDPSVVNLRLPCGSCVGCFSGRALEWARRCSHEASMWDHNSFVTLTYDDAHLPYGGGLEADELSKFVKRLRKHRGSSGNKLIGDFKSGIRFFAAGEYGEQRQRPHYHILLFNCGFSDAILCGVSKMGDKLYESPTLSALWEFGGHKIGLVSGASANYVAQYSLKNWGNWDPNLPVPFVRASLRPAIGYSWVDAYRGDLRHGYLVVDGHKVKIPRSYRKRLEALDPVFAEGVSYEAFSSTQLLRRSDCSSPARLEAGEVIHMNKLSRSRGEL